MSTQDMSLETELVTVTKVKAKKGEERQAFLGRLAVAATDKISEEEWEKLSDAAQEWANDAVKAQNRNADIPEFPTEEGEAGTNTGAEGDEEEQPEAEAQAPATKAAAKAAKKPSNKAAAPKAAKPKPDAAPEPASGDEEEEGQADAPEPQKPVGKAAKPAKEPKAAKAAKPVTDSAPPAAGSMTYLKEQLIRDPAISTKDLYAKLQGQGFKTSEVCVGTWRSYFRHSMKVLKAAGLLDAEFAAKI